MACVCAHVHGRATCVLMHMEARGWHQLSAPNAQLTCFVETWSLIDPGAHGFTHGAPVTRCLLSLPL